MIFDYKRGQVSVFHFLLRTNTPSSSVSVFDLQAKTEDGDLAPVLILSFSVPLLFLFVRLRIRDLVVLPFKVDDQFGGDRQILRDTRFPVEQAKIFF